MTSRGSVCDKWHRYCQGCGRRHHINAVKSMDGNECCSGETFSRERP